MGTFLFDYWVIKHCGLFDPVYYLLTYPDVRIADTDPIKHFVNYGWKEGRNPSESFITTFYVNTNPDVQLAGRNPLVHYVLHGKKEGRVPRPGALPLSSISGVSLFDRTFQKIARKIYQALPLSIMQRERLKKFLIRYFPQVLRLNGFGQGGNYPFHLSSTASNLVDIAQQNPLLSVSKQIAVHVHIFYGELISEFERYLGNMPFDYDLYVSVVSEDVQRLCEQIFARLPNIHKLTVRVVPNRGRDLAPFFCVFGPFLKQYDVVAHFHSKKSLYNRGNTVGWREYLLRELLGSKDQIRRIFNLLLGDNAFGMVYPQTFHLVHIMPTPGWQIGVWLKNTVMS
jgi:DNA-binding Lrp family transcriptional regulator